VYFGAVGIRRMGDALKVGLLADLVGIAAAIFIVTIMF
jgi:spore maturation protein B